MASPFLSLPSELIELTIIHAAATEPVSVAALAQTCRAVRALVYGPSDHHLWREIFLTTFDDPRHAEAADKEDVVTPTLLKSTEDSGSKGNEQLVTERSFSWRSEFCERVWGMRYLRRVTARSEVNLAVGGERTTLRSKNIRAIEPLLSVVSTALPCTPTIVMSFLSDSDAQSPRSDAESLARQLPIFPPSLNLWTPSTVVRGPDGRTTSLTDTRSVTFGHEPAKNISWLETAVTDGFPPDLTMLMSGRTLPGGSQGVWEDKEEESEMQLFSRLLCFTGFIPIPEKPEDKVPKPDVKSSDAAVDPTEESSSGSGTGEHNHNDAPEEEDELPEDEGPAPTDIVAEGSAIGTTLTYASAPEPEDNADDEEAEVAASLSTSPSDPVITPKLAMDIAAQKLRARRIGRMRVYNMQYLSRERHWGPYLLPPGSKLKDKDRDDIEVDFLNPIIELFAEHDAGHPHHHHDHDDEDGGVEADGEDDMWDELDDDDEDAHEAALLQFPPEAFPPPPLPKPSELYADWTYLATVRVVVEANLREAVRADALSGLTWLDGLRRGSAPKAVSPIKDTAGPSATSDEKGRAKAKDGVDGWDWAGIEGDWKRCVCWLDYRDLILHNVGPLAQLLVAHTHVELRQLARQFNDPNLQEAVRIVPMRLRVASYSPCPIPGYAHRPTIHVIGETAGPAGSGSIRKMKGTVGMIADGNIRWNLYSCVDETGPAEWVTEGIQIGEATSGMGVLGMWTGAQHERMDPLGPFWSWKVG